MNKKNIFSLLLGAMLMLFAACEPIEDRKELSNSFNPDNIQLEVVHSAPGSNSFSLYMNTSGVAGYWDFITGTKFTDKVDVVFPVVGEYDFTYHVTTAYMPNNSPSETEYIEKTISVNIENLDTPLPQQYYDLAGETLDGKTWVFAGVPFDNTLWWYMVADYNHEEVWWNAAGECCPPATKDGVMDAASEITFTLLGDYLKTLGDNTEETKWALSDDLKNLILSNPELIPGYQNEWGEPRANPEGKYEIIELTKDRLVLFTSVTINGGSGWKWVFVPKAE